MPRGDQVARLYTILLELEGLKRGLPAATLAERHEWNPRTTHRDLVTLQKAGIPLESDGGRWKLIEGWKRALPFPLPAAERAAMHVARVMLRPLGGTPFAAGYERLHDRLVGVHAPKQGELFPRIQSQLSTPSLLAIDYREHRAMVETLAKAVEGCQTVRAVYVTASRNELTRRDLDPLHLHYDPRLEALYLFAYCHLRQDIRTFAVHRFKQAHATDRRFAPRPDFTPERHLEGAFRVWRAQNVTDVRLAIDPPDATWVGERRWHASQSVKKRPDGGCVLALTVDPGVELERFILQLGAAVDVLDPVSLRVRVARIHEAAAKRVGAGAQEPLAMEEPPLSESGGRGGVSQ